MIQTAFPWGQPLYQHLAALEVVSPAFLLVVITFDGPFPSLLDYGPVTGVLPHLSLSAFRQFMIVENWDRSI